VGARTELAPLLPVPPSSLMPRFAERPRLIRHLGQASEINPVVFAELLLSRIGLDNPPDIYPAAPL